MTFSASKVLLGISLATYGYCLRGQFTSAMKIDSAEGGKEQELTPAMVNSVAALQLVRDPFTGISIQPLKNDQMMQNPSAKPVGKMVLQAVMVSESRRSAVINGKTIRQGEVATLEKDGAPICARSIGVGYVVVETGGELTTLRMPKVMERRDPEVPASDVGGVELEQP